MEDFNSMISDCNLNDIGYFGSPYMWYRANLWQRLDRFLFNDDWLALLPSSSIEHLSRTLSDHSPLLLNINKSLQHNVLSFRFQNMWMLHADFPKMLSTNWNAPVYPDNNISGMLRLWSKLSRLKQCLRWWNKCIFKNLFANIKDAENKVSYLENIFQSNPNSDNMIDLNQAKDSLLLLQRQEEWYWNQKSNAKFIVEGDRNTKFFHALANKKKSRCHIHKIIDVDGSILISEEAICNSGVAYFKNAFTSSSNCLPFSNTHIIPNIISEDDNIMLCQTPSKRRFLESSRISIVVRWLVLMVSLLNFSKIIGILSKRMLLMLWRISLLFCQSEQNSKNSKIMWFYA
ncbi:uncharacterized protein LOC114581016 [Dendrobium catenatum]|uniref:uncharacterized protein LOC114581016 n=1 Tax=Dendrobium catenatum TaxID=906689 RepID=UPI00109EE9D1|nr:uncharacterized protein LOC114581016 [Dendrobium catenatum]XP_028556083.1 uncharacterized protein LOC114581016 [Dendrobium catenatum]